MSIHFADIARKASADRGISKDEILKLRRAGWADGKMERAEVEALFTAQHAIDSDSDSGEWAEFFTQAVMNYVLEGSEPIGYASETEARWLIDQVMQDGAICSFTELELLVRIIERAKNVADILKDFVLKSLEQEVLTGTGPTRCGGELSDSHVTDAECVIIRRVIFGAAGERPAGVSQNEAEMLYRLKNACLGKDNAQAFEMLFVQGVGNYLQGLVSQNGQIDHDRAVELEAFITDTKTNIGGFLSRMTAAGALKEVFGKEKRVSRESNAIADYEVSEEERKWLDTKIAENGHIDQYDQALLRFIAEG